MKRITIMRIAIKTTLSAIFVLLLSVLNCKAAELELKQAPEGPSYEDTVNFLVSKYKYKSESTPAFMKIDSINNCVVVESSVGVDSTTGSFRMDLRKVTSVYVKSQPNMIPEVTVVTETPDFPTGRNHYWMNNTEFAERFAKAMNHLRKLCGAKDDPF